jgi:hypothetical protein
MQKLGLHSLKELKYYAFEQGITPHPGVADKPGEVKKGTKSARKPAEKSGLN